MKAKKNDNKSTVEEIAVIGSISAAFVPAMMQSTPATNPIAWIAPSGIIAVYVLFRLWNADWRKETKKRNEPVKPEPSWTQLAIQLALYTGLYFITTGLLRGNIDGYNELFSVLIALGYFVAVPFVLKRLVWPKFYADKRGG